MKKEETGFQVQGFGGHCPGLSFPATWKMTERQLLSRSYSTVRLRCAGRSWADPTDPPGPRPVWRLKRPVPGTWPPAKWETDAGKTTSLRFSFEKIAFLTPSANYPESWNLGVPKSALRNLRRGAPEGCPGCCVEVWVWVPGPQLGHSLPALGLPRILAGFVLLGHYTGECYRLNCVPPLKFVCWNPNPQCDHIWRWGF